jgi:hypothetical protein
VKAQIHAGGRGKGKFKELAPDAKGGVRLAKTLEEVEANAKEMLGNTLVTIQTGEAGKQVNRLYITDGVDIGKEYYLSMLVDRASGRVAMIVSTEGGMTSRTWRTTRPKRSPRSPSIRPQGFSRTTAARWPSRSSSRAISTSRRRSWQAALRRLHGARLLDARDQPAGRTPTASCWCSTPR